jgi:hypothetical protein
VNHFLSPSNGLAYLEVINCVDILKEEKKVFFYSKLESSVTLDQPLSSNGLAYLEMINCVEIVESGKDCFLLRKT